MAIKYSTLIRTDKMTSVNTDIGTSAKLRIYSGTRPASVQVAISTQTLLADLTCNAAGFGTSSNGLLTANAITNATAAASGTASFFRIFKSDGTTACIDGTVATSGADLNLNTTAVVLGQTVGVSSFTILENNG